MATGQPQCPQVLEAPVSNTRRAGPGKGEKQGGEALPRRGPLRLSRRGQRCQRETCGELYYDPQARRVRTHRSRKGASAPQVQPTAPPPRPPRTVGDPDRGWTRAAPQGHAASPPPAQPPGPARPARPAPPAQPLAPRRSPSRPPGRAARCPV